MDDKKFEEILSNGYFIIDTCTLDYISRCEFEYAKHIMDIFLFCKERILVPYHVVNEMQPYFDMKKIQENVDGIINELESELQEIYVNQDIDEKQKRRMVVRRVTKKINRLKKFAFQVYAAILEELKIKYTRQQSFYFPSLSECIELAEKEIDAILKNEIVNSFLSMIMKNTLPNFDEQEKQLLEIDVTYRCKNDLPPGVGDSGKYKNSNGDVVIWNEIKKCIKDKGYYQYLFITNDEKKHNNWFGKDNTELHTLLKKEIHSAFHYNALDISTLYNFIAGCKPYVDTDIDKICVYLLNHNDSIINELTNYFAELGSEELMESISDYIRQNHMGDWASPYDYDIDIYSIEYTIDSLNDSINVSFGFLLSGNIEACYHCGGEDNMFDAEYSADGTAAINMPIQIGNYTKNMRLDYNRKELNITDIEVETTDPLNEDEEYEYENDDFYNENDEDF